MSRSARLVVTVQCDVHRQVKAAAALKGRQLGALVTDILRSWLQGEVYICPERCGAAPQRRDEEASA